MTTALEPARGGAVTPAQPGPAANAVQPHTPPATPQPRRGGAPNLAAHSNLDEINALMVRVSLVLSRIADKMPVLAKTTESLDAVLDNVAALAELYEAPLATRDASDAAGTVAALVMDLVNQVGQLVQNAQLLNAQAFINQGAVVKVQDRQRAIGAGPRITASAGR